MNFVDYDIIKVHIFSKVKFQVLERMYVQIAQAIECHLQLKTYQSIDFKSQTLLVRLFIALLSITLLSILDHHHKCNLWYSVATTNNINQCEFEIYHVS